MVAGPSISETADQLRSSQSTKKYIDPVSSLRENALLMSVVREQTVSSLEEGISHSNNHSLNTNYAAAYFLMHNTSNLEVDEL